MEGLALGPADTLLDLCCGNGALTDRLFARCRGGLGVDFSEDLVEVAHERFQRRPDRVYVLGDVAAHVTRTADTERFTRALCYGAFSYLTEESARALLTGLRRRPAFAFPATVQALSWAGLTPVFCDVELATQHDLAACRPYQFVERLSVLDVLMWSAPAAVKGHLDGLKAAARARARSPPSPSPPTSAWATCGPR